MHPRREFQSYGSCAAEPKQGVPRSSFSSYVFVALLPIGAFLLTGLVGCSEKEKPAPPAPPEVTVATVVQQDVPIYNDWVAQLNGPVNAEITPKVQGYLLKQEYQNGFFVKKGQRLFELDPRQYEAALDAAKASVARAQANFAKYEADVARDTPLAAQNAIPQKQLDNDTANRDAAAAEVLAEKASEQNAELNLAWTNVNSPIDGIAGVSNSQIGDLVGTATKMTTVSQVNPIWAYFNISESAYLGVSSRIEGIISGRVSQESLSRTPIEFVQANDVPLSAKGSFCLRQSPGWKPDRHDSNGGRIRQPERRASSWRIWTGADSDRHESQCAVSSAACRYRCAVELHGPCGWIRSQSKISAGENGGACGPELDRQRRAAAGRGSRGRRD